MKKRITLFIFTAIILFSSCSIQKRLYLKGYNFTKHKTSGISTSMDFEQNPKNNYSTSIQNENPIINNSPFESSQYNSYSTVQGDSCDFIKLNNNRILKAKVTQINSYEIHYRLCDERGIGKREIIFARDKVASITFSNGTVEIITPLMIPSNEICYDVIQTRSRKIKGTVYEINSDIILYDSLLNDGQFKKTFLRKRNVTKIVFCGGTTTPNADLRKVNTSITDRKDMTDSLFWNKYHFDVIVKKGKKEGNGLIKGFVSEIAADTIKIIPYDNSQNQEVKISTKNIKQIDLYNKEKIRQHEIEHLKNKISSNIEIQKYSKSIERKETLVKEFTKKSLFFGIAAFLLPILGIPFGIKAIKYSNMAKAIIKTTPELKKHKIKSSIGIILGLFGLIFSCIELAVVVLVGLWYLIFIVLGISIL